MELRAQYDRRGQLVRAVEEFYDQDATLPCLAYGELAILSSEIRMQNLLINACSLAGTPPGPVGSDAFGRPPPYT